MYTQNITLKLYTIVLNWKWMTHLENNQKLSFCAYPDDKDYPWEITAYPIIAATFENITAYQDLLESSAQAFKGKYDGWYCVNAAKLPY